MSRRTLVLLAIAVALTVQALFFEERTAPWERLGKVFRELDAQDVLEVEISRPVAPGDAEAGAAPEKIVLRREGEPRIWWIVSPIRFPAFHPRVMGIVSELVDLARIADVPPGTEAFPRGPEISVRMKTRYLGDLSIEFGMDHPDPQLDFTYARVGGEVFVARKSARRALTVSLEELRSRALVPVAAPDAVALSVRGDAASSKRFERVGESERWRLKEPLDASADRERTDELLRDLNSWTIASFEKDDAASEADLEPYGLAAPLARVSVRHRIGFEASLEIGKEFRSHGEIFVYLRRPGEPFVFSAEKGKMLEKILAPPDYYRNRYVFDIWLEDIEEIRFEGSAASIRVRRLEREEASKREKSSPETAWEIEDVRASAKYRGDPDRIGTIVASLQRLPIERFFGPEVRDEAVGLQPPLGTLRLKLSSGRELELYIGGPCEDPAFRDFPVIYVRVPGEPGPYLIGDRIFRDLAQGGAFLRNRKLSELDFTEVLEFQVVDGEESWFLGRVPGEDWTVSAETPLLPGAMLDQELVERLLRQLDQKEFAVVRYVPEIQDFASLRLELSAPRRAIALLEPKDLPGFRKLVIGVPFGEEGSDEVYARVELGGVPPFTLAESGVPAALEALLKHLRKITGKERQG